eukprot:TRINITY_DN12748_c0_g1_i27.p1 TRINITY_DN12748_c0_g1~~TRINITY_DN12748_c0_g1_i27.p1  ORF type:complete len:140 (-),score=25.68 TRINITY_DN12748_c0_g1_i27:231-650(-)
MQVFRYDIDRAERTFIDYPLPEPISKVRDQCPKCGYIGTSPSEHLKTNPNCSLIQRLKQRNPGIFEVMDKKKPEKVKEPEIQPTFMDILKGNESETIRLLLSQKRELTPEQRVEALKLWQQQKNYVSCLFLSTVFTKEG